MGSVHTEPDLLLRPQRSEVRSEPHPSPPEGTIHGCPWLPYWALRAFAQASPSARHALLPTDVHLPSFFFEIYSLERESVRASGRRGRGSGRVSGSPALSSRRIALSSRRIPGSHRDPEIRTETKSPKPNRLSPTGAPRYTLNTFRRAVREGRDQETPPGHGEGRPRAPAGPVPHTAGGSAGAAETTRQLSTQKPERNRVPDLEKDTNFLKEHQLIPQHERPGDGPQHGAGEEPSAGPLLSAHPAREGTRGTQVPTHQLHLGK